MRITERKTESLSHQNYRMSKSLSLLLLTAAVLHVFDMYRRIDDKEVLPHISLELLFVALRSMKPI